MFESLRRTSRCINLILHDSHRWANSTGIKCATWPRITAKRMILFLSVPIRPCPLQLYICTQPLGGRSTFLLIPVDTHSLKSATGTVSLCWAKERHNHSCEIDKRNRKPTHHDESKTWEECAVTRKAKRLSHVWKKCTRCCKWPVELGACLLRIRGRLG